MPSKGGDEAEEYAVGYGKPPSDHKFKPGASGNPKGRPKGSLNLGKAVQRAAKEKVIIIENGQRKTVNKMDAAAKQVVNKSAAGDLNAIKVLGSLFRFAEEQLSQQPIAQKILRENDEKLILSVFRRLGNTDEES